MKTLIVGSSIAGPALAWWLSRAGFDVTLIERAPALRTGGYAVDIRGPALQVLEWMGLREAVRPFETDTEKNSAVDGAGKRFAEMPRGFGVLDPGDVEIHRGDLATLLCRSMGPSVKTIFDESVRALQQRERGVFVEFTGTTPAQEFELVVGADGVHSQVRALAFGPEEQFTKELGSAMAIFSAPNHLGLHREQLLFSTIGRIASIKSAERDTLLKLAVFFTVPPGTLRGRTVPQQRALVREAFADQGFAFPTLLDAMEVADDFYCDVTAQVHLDAFHAGRVALIGDAAACPSPLSGQGTSLALVGAYVLAQKLVEHRDDVPRALKETDALVLPFARKNQKIALELAAGFAPKTKLGAWFRNFGMRSLAYLPWSGWMMEQMMKPIRAASRDIVLPERAITAA
jgi:2-polyprenyl-6-methoxyphenol hydroxylase-like FAD-dependent oxidoreductase